MNKLLTLPLRYLFSKKSSNAIHWITGISIMGIAVGTASLILVLCIFNGFEELLGSFFSKHNPDIKIVSIEGKFFKQDSLTLQKLKSINGVKALSITLEENALFTYSDAQDFGTILGIDSVYATVTKLDEAIIEKNDISCDNNSCASIGLGVRNKLGIDLSNPIEEIRVFIPTVDQVNQGPDVNSLKSMHIKPARVFNIHQEQDYEFVLTDLKSLRNYVGDPLLLSSIILKLENTNDQDINNKIQQVMGPKFEVRDRSKQDESFIKIMKLEKWLFFALFSLTLIIVCFTLIGALWMIVLEKRMDIAILKSLGMMDNQIKHIFIRLGLLITMIGILIGYAIAILFYFIQKKYGIISVPDEFIIDSYPIALSSSDFIIVFITVMVIGWIASLLPARKITSIAAIFREE